MVGSDELASQLQRYYALRKQIGDRRARAALDRMILRLETKLKSAEESPRFALPPRLVVDEPF